MLPTDKLTQAGDYPFFFSGERGELEAILTVPLAPHPKLIALLGHPHSLQGGTMNNKVVTTLARACKELNILSIRFNFRGVGQSEGVFDAGIGESEDMLALMRLCELEMAANTRFIFAGFSFGSYVAYRAAAKRSHELLITIAPPIHHFNFQEFKAPSPWVIVQGEEDEVVPLPLVLDFAHQFSPALIVHRFAETSHFFHGKLMELKATLMEELNHCVKK